jgi:hypothetical protein
MADNLPDFALKASKLFSDEKADWVDGNGYVSDQGYLRIRAKIFIDDVITGEFALGGPPTEQEVDAWEASKLAGVWDYWEFLKFYIVPGHGTECDTLIIYFAADTIFDRPMEKIDSLQIPHIEHYYFKQIVEKKLTTYCMSVQCDEDCHWHGDEHYEHIVREVRCEQIVAALKKKYDMRILEGLTWTDGGTKFDASFPDQ